MCQLFITHNACSLAMADTVSPYPTFSADLCPPTVLLFLNFTVPWLLSFSSGLLLIIFIHSLIHESSFLFFKLVTMCQILFCRWVSLVLLVQGNLTFSTKVLSEVLRIYFEARKQRLSGPG